MNKMTPASDPIADMLTRIRNAVAVHRHEVVMPYSKTKEAVAQLLKENGFLVKVHVDGEGKEKALTLTLSTAQTNARFTHLARLSKPGRRMYAGAKEMPEVMRGRGIVIVSTSKGLMTGRDAKAASMGGELICEVY